MSERQEALNEKKLGTATNGGPLIRVSVFFAIIGGFMCRLMKLLLKAVPVLFCGKSSIFQFIRTLLSMREFFTHQLFDGRPLAAVGLLKKVRLLRRGAPRNDKKRILVSLRAIRRIVRQSQPSLWGFFNSPAVPSILFPSFADKGA
ncbi:MAG: hypothetical protein CEE38_03290 [Planctomycetes bacterium B3_Pla]|nr:MAG: hypothetical protein CEE38_03290 [Planctomycetes bacterium B3_Pla]